MLTPFEPPVGFSECPPCGGRLAQEPEDFQVDEVPLYPFCGEGEHLMVRLRKRDLTTQQMVRHVAQQAGVGAREIGVAGMKDKHAVTSQWLSLPARGARDPESWQLPREIQLLEVARHSNKLRTGHVRGNHFRIRLTGVRDVKAARAIAQALGERGMPNYFGAQRFGVGLQNLNEALAFLQAKPGRKSQRFTDKLYPSVVQAEIFNRYVALRLEAGAEQLLPGEVVRLSGSSRVFLVTDPEREQPRLRDRDIFLTGPIWGPKMREAEHAARALELQSIAALGLGEEVLQRLAKLVPGTRRDLLVFPEQFDLRAGEVPDELVVSFFLPAGSYATEVLRQFTGDAFANVR